MNSKIQLFRLLYNNSCMKIIILQIIVGFIFADIDTGTFHWFEDTYLDYCINIPILDSILKDNELHRYFPRFILAYTYLYHISLIFPLTVIVEFIIYFLNKSTRKYFIFLCQILFIDSHI